MMKNKCLGSIMFCAIAVSGSVSAHEGKHKHTKEVVAQSGVLTGSGKHRFLADSTWGKFDGETEIGPTHGGVVIDKSGKIYVSTDASHGILVYDSEGKNLGSFGKGVRGVHSMAIGEVDGNQVIYCAHLHGKSSLGPGRFVMLSLEGEELLQIPNEKTGEIPGGLKGVTGVTVTKDGTIFLSCGYGSNYILKFDSKGKFLSHFGGKSDKNHEFNTPHGISVDYRFGEPRLLVADREKRRLVHFTLNGEFIGEYATNLRRPCAVSFHGNFCAVAELQARVTILDKKGVPVAFLGDNPNGKQWAKFNVEKADQTPGIFSAPHGLSYDSKGNIYVQDWNKYGRLTKLAAQK